jgi:hypothetical protein
MAKRGLKGLYKLLIFDLGGSLVNLDSYDDYKLLNETGIFLSRYSPEYKCVGLVQSLVEKQASAVSELDHESGLDLIRVGVQKLQKLNIDELRNRLVEDGSLTMVISRIYSFYVQLLKPLYNYVFRMKTFTLP